MSDFIIATDMHVIRKSEVVIVTPLKQDGYTEQYYFDVTVSSGVLVNVNCCNKDEPSAQVERGAFLRSLTN